MRGVRWVSGVRGQGKCNDKNCDRRTSSYGVWQVVADGWMRCVCGSAVVLPTFLRLDDTIIMDSIRLTARGLPEKSKVEGGDESMVRNVCHSMRSSEKVMTA